MMLEKEPPVALALSWSGAIWACRRICRIVLARRKYLGRHLLLIPSI